MEFMKVIIVIDAELSAGPSSQQGENLVEVV
jgi:hypothetical protein